MKTYDAYNRMYAGTNVYAVQQDVTFKLQSDYVNQTDYTWLNELIASPEVYLEQGGYHYPVSVKTSSWEEKLRASDKMFNMTLDVDYGRNINSQFR
jgi:hypothetical protein